MEERKPCIFLVDDNIVNLNMGKNALQHKYTIITIPSGEKLFAALKKLRPDLILLDVEMPGMSGYDTIKGLKINPETANIPVIFLTAKSANENELQGLSLGAVDYITKPFNKAIVKARVNTHIRIVDQMRTIEKIGLVDMLTKIANRRGFEDRLKVEWNRAMREVTPISILVMDIDKFKAYNDSYGHQQGDVALKAFADAASRSLKRAVDFAARWGGEEFLILLPGTGPAGAAEIAERVRRNVESAVILTDEGKETRVTVSIGVNSVVPTAEDSTKDFIGKADQALYKAKKAGRNRCVVHGA